MGGSNIKISENCTGCGVCESICPYSAIKMENVNGFLHAKIDENKCKNCNLCRKYCPNNIDHKINNPKIIVCRNKNLKNAAKSSSAGIFALIAKTVILNKGIVYGAVFDSSFNVIHTKADNLVDLEKMYKSKYAKSNLNKIFEEIRLELNKGTNVLFSGTPCQVGSLKLFLKKEYDNLDTIDLICHGVPSNIIWNKYLKKLEKNYSSKIVDVDFRFFNKKSPEKGFLIKFNNGKIINLPLIEDTYGKAFLTNLISDKCCFNCKYNAFRNESDITIGDAWGYKNSQFPNKNSIVFLNSKNGQKLFENIENELLFFNDFNIVDLVNNNYPIIHPSLTHYNNGKVNVASNNIIEELNKYQIPQNGLKKDEKGVGILNFHYENYNYGANLVAYSLSEIVKSMGFNPYVIDFDPFPELSPILRYSTINFYYFRQKYLKMTPKYKNASELSQLNRYFSQFITGSDQVWRKLITQNNIYTYFLDFVSKENKKIAYAASFGTEKFEGDCIESIKCSSLLSNFDAISVREEKGVTICHDTFNINSIQTLDPTLLLTQDDYEKIIDEEYDSNIDIAMYFVMDHDNKMINNKYLKQNFPTNNIINIKGHYESLPFGSLFKYNSISMWLDGIRKCKILITDSFHGLVFGILFQKRVICIGKKSAALSRFESLFNQLGGNLEKINYNSIEEVDFANLEEIDYSIINKNLENTRNKSLKYLKESLSQKHEIFNSDFQNNINNLIDRNDELLNEIINKDQAINELSCINDGLVNNINLLNKQLVNSNIEFENLNNSKRVIIANKIANTLNKIRGKE